MATLRRSSRGAVGVGAAIAVAATGLLGGLLGSLITTDAGPGAAVDARAHDATSTRAPTVGARRIVVSLGTRHLWLIEGRDTLLSAPVAVGKGQNFTYRGKTYRFQTPRGTRRVIAKEVDPVWVPPDWHYYEKAVRQDLDPVHLERGKSYRLGDGTTIEIRDDRVGRVNRFGNFWPFTPGMEIIFDGKIFIPPLDTEQRRVPDALGTHKLDLGNGYLIHGTHVHNQDSIGRAVSHGCIRMRNRDVARLFDMVEVGTPVHIK